MKMLWEKISENKKFRREERGICCFAESSLQHGERKREISKEGMRL
jgi:hypothetical protein